MILLRPDCLVFRTAGGENIPCSAHQVTIELIGESIGWLDKNLVSNAAEAVLHYFKTDLGKDLVSMAEFSAALEKVLRGFGLDVKAADAPPAGAVAARRVIEADLSQLADDSTSGGELLFFPRLREEMRRRLDGAPLVLRFRGLRACVKLLAGTKRWSTHCQRLNDHIVDYLRTCLSAETAARGCALVVF